MGLCVAGVEFKDRSGAHGAFIYELALVFVMRGGGVRLAWIQVHPRPNEEDD